MVLKSYFDGANQPDRIVLATVSGTSNQWEKFESTWRKILYKHKATHLHTTDAVSLQKEFSVEKGWDKTSVNAFIEDCLMGISKHIAQPPTPHRPHIKPGLRATTLTIYLDDYKEARKSLPKLPVTVTDLCLSESLGFCFKWGRYIGARQYEMYFDQGEPFYGHLCDRMNSKKARKDVPLLDAIAHKSESNMRDVPAKQMANLLAWCISHNENATRMWHRQLNDLPWSSLYLDEKYLSQPTEGRLEQAEQWGMPRRKPNPR